MVNTYSKSFGFTDTKSATPLEVEVPQIDYASDWTLLSQTAKEVSLVNTTTPVDQPYTCRFAIQDVANVYKGRPDIDPVLYGPTKKGKSLVVDSLPTLRITNDQTGALTDYPLRVYTVCQWPVTAGIDASDLRTIIMQNLGLFFDAAATNDRIDELIRSALRPSEV